MGFFIDTLIKHYEKGGIHQLKLIKEGIINLHFFIFTALFFTLTAKSLQSGLRKKRFMVSKTMTFVMFNGNYSKLNLINTIHIHTNKEIKK